MGLQPAPKRNATPCGSTSTGQRSISIRYWAAALSVTRPAAVPGFDPTTAEADLALTAVDHRRPEGGGERFGRLARARIAVVAHDRGDGRDRDVVAAREPRRSDRDRDRAAFEQAERGRAGLHAARRRAVLGAEHDQVGVLLLRQVAEPFRGRAAHDDVPRHVRIAEPRRARLEQSRRVGLRLSLARRIRLDRMPNVRERERPARPGQKLAEGERVGVVCGPVVRDDDRRAPRPYPVAGSGAGGGVGTIALCPA